MPLNCFFGERKKVVEDEDATVLVGLFKELKSIFSLVSFVEIIELSFDWKSEERDDKDFEERTDEWEFGFRLVIWYFDLDRSEGNGGLILNDVVVKLGFPLDRVSGAKDVETDDEDDEDNVEELMIWGFVVSLDSSLVFILINKYYYFYQW